ncbi:MAG: Fe-S-binding domain-containing protein, partial [Acidobacteria bacterium]|nr:Fe-S-binding domain-containing protein [Acidobacteriota bacterium]MDW7985517.1 Fe-S-binding domain-containing protein [Acidobacteriota bacterium]
LVVLLSSIGLPFLNGFVGEFLIFWGAFRRYPVATALAVTGIIWNAVYMLRMYQRVMHGPLIHEENRRLADMQAHEWAATVPLLVLAVWIGVWATPFLERTQTALRWITGLQ